MDIASLWDFGDPAGSEHRFRAAAADAESPDRDVLLTQVARALALQDRFAAGHAVLDALTASSAEVRVRTALERGRLLRSAGQPADAMPFFESAVDQADAAGLAALHVDALHMVALVLPPEEQLAANELALSVARESEDLAARNWDASLLNNIGMVHADAGDWDAALVAFKDALRARERIGDDRLIREARWMIAWTLRHLGRTSEALEMQRALRAEHRAAGTSDTYVDEEIALLEADGPTGASEHP